MRTGILYIVASIAFIFSAQKLSADPINVQNVEGGVQIFTTVPVGGNFGMKVSTPGFGIQSEIRYNFPQSRFDAGVYLRFGMVLRDHEMIDDTGNQYTSDECFRTYGIGIVSHYNFGMGKKVNPFVGFGIGMAFHNCDVGYISEAPSMAIVPEIGVELFKHMRIAVRYDINRRSYNQFQFVIGFTLGGRPSLSNR